MASRRALMRRQAGYMAWFWARAFSPIGRVMGALFILYIAKPFAATDNINKWEWSVQHKKVF